ncbi:hypothetical protein AKO1_007942 [Acrasis kona]
MFYGFFLDDPQRNVQMVFSNIEMQGHEHGRYLPTIKRNTNTEGRELQRIIELCLPTEGTRSLGFKSYSVNLSQCSPKLLTRFTSLTSLDLHGFTITGEQLGNIFSNCTQLKYVNIKSIHSSTCNISKALEQVVEYDLKKLDLGDESIDDEKFKNIVSKLPHLTELCIQNASKISSQTLISHLPLLTNLKTLTLEHCTNIDNATPSSTATLLLSPSIKQINIRHCLPSQTLLLNQMFSSYNNLKSVVMDGRLMGNTANGLQHLQTCTHLTKLRIDNAFSIPDSSFLKLAANQSIRVLEMEPISSRMYAILFNQTNLCKNLISLKISKANCDLKAIKMIADNCKMLKVLHLGDSLLTNDECVISLLQSCTDLTELSLQRCSITDKSAKILFSSNTLTTLDLTSNKVTDESVALLKFNWTLTDLNISGNDIMNRGMKVMMLENDTLKKLNVAYNKISAKGMRHVFKNMSLTSLTFSSKDSIPNELIQEILEKCSHIQHINVLN